MKSILLLLLSFFTFSYSAIFSQNFSVGTPVNELISSSTYYSYGGCYPENFDVTIIYPKSPITGVKNVLIISDISIDDTVLLSTGDTLHIGDTLVNDLGENIFTIYSSSIFSINFDLRAIGTPQIANETYICGDNYWVQTLADCSNSMSFIYYDNTSFCFVNDLPGIQPYIEENFAPSDDNLVNNTDSQFNFVTNLNPETSILTIENPNNCSISEINLIGLLGERLVIKIDGSQTIKADLSSSDLKVFYLEIKGDNRLFRRKLAK